MSEFGPVVPSSLLTEVHVPFRASAVPALFKTFGGHTIHNAHSEKKVSFYVHVFEMTAFYTSEESL